jgi:hypothetical protein
MAFQLQEGKHNELHFGKSYKEERKAEREAHSYSGLEHMVKFEFRVEALAILAIQNCWLSPSQDE